MHGFFIAVALVLTTVAAFALSAVSMRPHESPQLPEPHYTSSARESPVLSGGGFPSSPTLQHTIFSPQPKKVIADSYTAPSAPPIVEIAKQIPVSPPQTRASFERLEGEIQNAEATRSFFAPEHYERIMRDLNVLEQAGHPPHEISTLRMRAAELTPHIKDQQKQSSTAPSVSMSPTPQTPAKPNCESNPSPIFTNHITDMSRVNYIGPPPTMGAGPSLKPHSYIGTDHARVPIYAPTALTLRNGSHSVGGPYMFELAVSCEVTVRFGHITEPVEAIKKLLPSEPQPDSRTQELSPVAFASGELLGYTTGTDMAGNWDFGVYNSATKNRYADDPNWNNSAVYTTAVCPFAYFSENLRPEYVSRFNSAALGGNPPHGEPFCR